MLAPQIQQSPLFKTHDRSAALYVYSTAKPFFTPRQTKITNSSCVCCLHPYVCRAIPTPSMESSTLANAHIHQQYSCPLAARGLPAGGIYIYDANCDTTTPEQQNIKHSSLSSMKRLPVSHASALPTCLIRIAKPHPTELNSPTG